MIKRAFTLPEVLVTMMVLGLAMSLAMPSIMLSHEKNTTQAGFADAYKEANKAIFNYTVKNHCQGKLACTGLFNSDNPAEVLAPFFMGVQSGTDCWDGKGNNNGVINLNNMSCFVDGKGRIYAVESEDGTCSTNHYNSETDENNNVKKHKLQNSCGYLYVDLNGTKAPNTFGRDLFMFVITDASASYLYPNGGSLINPSGNLNNWTKTNCTSAGGITCGGRIVEEGWKVKYLK